MGGRRYLISWILMLLFVAGSVPVLSGCGQLGSDSSKSSDEDEDDSKKKKKKKKKKDDDEEEEEEEDDGGKKKKKKKKDDDDGDEQADNDDGGDKPTEVPPAPAPPPAPLPTPVPAANPAPANLLQGAVYKRIPTTTLEIPVPKGWNESKKGLYSGLTSPDEKVAIAFTVVTYKSELAGRLQDIERKLGISNEVKTGEKTTQIGPNKLNALIHDATCTFHGKPGKLSYVIVQQKGRSSVVLVIYASENDAKKIDDETAHAAILNIR